MTPLNTTARTIFAQALADCSIDRAVERTLNFTTNGEGRWLTLDGSLSINLNRLKTVRILSIGKAAGPMLQALLPRLDLPLACDVAGILIAPECPLDLPANFSFYAGGHPLPNAASFAGAVAALEMLHHVCNHSPTETLCLFLISGGASAMMELPLDSSISLADTIDFHRALVASGATIVQMNCVRKHFSAVKGGRLALAAGTAQKLTLFVSDVPPAHLDALASGPTLPDTTTVPQCNGVIDQYDLLDRFPPSVSKFFTEEFPETPKPGGLMSPSITLLDGAVLAHAAATHAASLGFHTVIDNTCDDWPFAEAADYLLERLRTLRQDHPRLCLISNGELSVRLPALLPATAAGGRNQHFALYAATQLRAGDASIAVLSAGSDGIDGNSSAAGAVIDKRTVITGVQRATAEHALASFESYAWLHAAGATIVTGPTGQNLRDLRLLLADAGA